MELIRLIRLLEEEIQEAREARDRKDRLGERQLEGCLLVDEVVPEWAGISEGDSIWPKRYCQCL